MAKKSRLKNSKAILAYDLGGTKVAAGLVSPQGHLLRILREPVSTEGGYKKLISQMAKMSQLLCKGQKVTCAAVASAGPLDPVKGTLLNPTNLKTDKEGWGEVPLVRELQKALKVKVLLENDAAAAVLAEMWKGEAKKHKNIIAVTLGTGLGVGVVANGLLVRSGRNLHPEAGHICIDMNDREFRCGCGNYGCAESFLSGHNFVERLKILWSEPDLSGETLLIRAQQGEKKVIDALSGYGEKLSFFLYSLVVLFSPEAIVLSGGFSHLSAYYMASVESNLKSLLKSRRVGHDLLPNIMISKFQDEAGLIGAAYLALKK